MSEHIRDVRLGHDRSRHDGAESRPDVTGEATPDGGWAVPVIERRCWHDGWAPIRKRRPVEEPQPR